MSHEPTKDYPPKQIKGRNLIEIRVPDNILLLNLQGIQVEDLVMPEDAQIHVPLGFDARLNCNCYLVRSESFDHVKSCFSPPIYYVKEIK